MIFFGSIFGILIFKIIRGKDFFYLDDENNFKIEAIPIFHPAYLLRNPIEKKHVWEDLKKIYKVIKKKRISLDG